MWLDPVTSCQRQLSRSEFARTCLGRAEVLLKAMEKRNQEATDDIGH